MPEARLLQFGSNTLLDISCSKHGRFLESPARHYGRCGKPIGCPLCEGLDYMDIEARGVTYMVNLDTPIDVECPSCGTTSQSIREHFDKHKKGDRK